jgi:hypothetical protein
VGEAVVSWAFAAHDVSSGFHQIPTEVAFNMIKENDSEHVAKIGVRKRSAAHPPRPE